MSAPPLTKPAHLRPALPSRAWWVSRPAACVAALLGVIGFVVAAVAQPALGTSPDPRLTLPALAATAIAAGISIARREPGGFPLWLAGLALAGAAVALGWFLLLAIVIGAAAVVILIVHAVM